MLFRRGQGGRAARALAAAAATTLVWVNRVGWDLSTVDENGNVYRMGNDVMSGRDLIALLAAIAVVAAIGGTAARNRADAGVVAVITAAALMTWRGAAARVVGANMFLLGTMSIVMYGGLAAVAGTAVGTGIGGVVRHRRARRGAR